MFSSRHLIATACAGLLIVAGAPGAAATGGSSGKAQADGIELIERPSKRFERSIEAHLERVEEREARREARERRQARRERREARRQAQLEAQAQAEGEPQPEAGDVGAAGEVGVSSATLESIAACESGGDPSAVNPAGYYGKYQFDQSTWQSVGGSGNPAEASEAEQDHRAALLYSQSGASPWPVCGS